jgi:hypothetical protein
LHNQRRLDEASREYARALELDPPRPPSASELETIRRFAPRVYTTSTEPFPLRNAAAILHPSERLIAYHLFWEDDIDFPDDNDPCDHEVVWVRHSSDGRSLERFWTYFHGRILEAGDAALDEARGRGMRPRVHVQWGKHGSLPIGWEQLTIVPDAGDIEHQYLTVGAPTSLLDYNRATWKKLRTDGRRLIGHPLSERLRWPDRFDGDWPRFVDFSRSVELLPLIDRDRLVSVSRWNSAVINQRFLAYNFRPKTEWPIEVAASREASPAPIALTSLDDLQLPSRSIFDAAMPRYPNVWFYVDASLTDSYDAAIRLVANQLRGPMRLRESHGPFSNPKAVTSR